MNEVLNKIRGKIGLKAECILETDEERLLVWDALDTLEKADKYKIETAIETLEKTSAEETDV